MSTRLDRNSLSLLKAIRRSAGGGKKSGESGGLVEKVGMALLGSALTLLASTVTFWFESQRRDAEFRLSYAIDVNKRNEAALEKEIAADLDLLTKISSASREELVWTDEYLRHLRVVQDGRLRGAVYDQNKQTLVMPLATGQTPTPDDIEFERRVRASFIAVEAGVDLLETRRKEWIRMQSVRQLQVDWSFGQGNAFSTRVSHPMRRAMYNLKNFASWVAAGGRDHAQFQIVDHSGPEPGDAFTMISGFDAGADAFRKHWVLAQASLKTFTADAEQAIRAKKGKLDDLRLTPLPAPGQSK